MSAELERQLEAELLQNYEAAKYLKPPYVAPRFLRMVNEHGGKETADRLLATNEPSEGFTKLFLRGRDNLRLSVEYVVLRPCYRTLFTDDQLEVAKKRLAGLGVQPPTG